MKAFMVELSIAREDAGAVERAAHLTERAAQQITRLGSPVRYLRSIHIRDDDTCFLLYAADTMDAVRAAAATGRPLEHVAEVVEEPRP